MALRENVEYVFAPEITVILNKACFVGTKKHMYVVPDERMAVEKSLGELFANALTRTTVLESITLGDQPPRQVIAEILAAGDTTLDSLHEFFTKLKAQWDAVVIVDLDGLDKLKVKAGFFGGSITAKQMGKMGYTAVATSIPKPQRDTIKSFYADIAGKR